MSLRYMRMFAAENPTQVAAVCLLYFASLSLSAKLFRHAFTIVWAMRTQWQMAARLTRGAGSQYRRCIDGHSVSGALAAFLYAYQLFPLFILHRRTAVNRLKVLGCRPSSTHQAVPLRPQAVQVAARACVTRTTCHACLQDVFSSAGHHRPRGLAGKPAILHSLTLLNRIIV